jgi:hypothetical protein
MPFRTRKRNVRRRIFYKNMSVYTAQPATHVSQIYLNILLPFTLRPLNLMGSREYIKEAVAQSRQVWSSSLGVGRLSTTPRTVLCITRFTVQKFYFRSTECIYVFCIALRTNSDFFFMQHYENCFCNREEMCLLRGTK